MRALAFFDHSRFVALVVLAAVAMIFSCGRPPDSVKFGLTAACMAPADQKGSFMARVASYPLKVRVDSRFTLSQRQIIAQAVSTWNSVGYTILRGPIFAVESTPVSGTSLSGDPRSCGSDLGGSDSFAILRETSNTHWSSIGLAKTVPAATFRCDTGVVSQQVIYTFPELVSDAQFSSIVLHELGHSIGLDHSCLDKEGRSDYRSCFGLEEAHAYRQAVMYPWLRTSAAKGAGEVKDALRDNDKLRAGCVVGAD